ncbi:MAG: polysaccharide pyruvyl transferase family protein [Bacteroidota bacterium]
MRILITGQCTLHWGRMEFGNIGNYYIIEPFVRLLQETFPAAELVTTFQMSDRFCRDEKIHVLPMDLYYGWNNDLEKAEEELEIAKVFIKTGKLEKITPYIEEARKADLVIDFSGDIWGDNADFLGNDRFYVGLCKDRVAQMLAPKTVMLAGSPGPFDNKKNLEFAKDVYANFDLVTNREFISVNLLENDGFDTSKTHSLACPAFRFEPADIKKIENLPQVSDLLNSKRPKIGFVICGWNFIDGPFDKWPRPDSDYHLFADAIEKFSSKVDADIYLMSHSNGFPISPKKFELKHGRDYPIIKQLQKVLKNRGKTNNIYALDGVYNAWQTKAIIGQFDMFVSGRVHGAVAALSQFIPTVIIDYGHEPKAHKLRGFAEVVNAFEYVAAPDKKNELLEKMLKCWRNKMEYQNNLKQQIPKVKELAQKNFNLLKTLF